MHVTIRLFAAHREAAGRSTYIANLPDGCTVADVFRHVCAEFPDISRTARSVAFARNRELASGDVLVDDGDEIAFLPPVAGG
jgi:molybdopterin converting factor subunit 1